MEEAQRYISHELSGIYSGLELQSVTRLVMSSVTGLGFTGLLVNKYTAFSDNQWDVLKKYVEELKSGAPVQYVLGETEFCGLTLSVGSGVLIPRPETEELVEWSVQVCPPSARILDVGTGSGCIAIALKHLRPDCLVDACDVSQQALIRAQTNALACSVDIGFFYADVLCNSLPDKKWDVIISNPPYIPRKEAPEMEVRVKDFEPMIALFVDDNDPLQFYRAIALHALHHLSPGGQLLFETHYLYAKKCLHMLLEMGFSHGELRKDISGKERMIRVTN